MGLFKKLETDLGVCARLKCPFCNKESSFSLRKVGTALSYGGVSLLEFDRMYRLFCPCCKYHQDIEANELPLAEKAIELYSQFTRHEITDEQYQRSVAELNFQTFNNLRQAANTWRCPSCNEDVPANFNECWKCHASRSQTHMENTSEPSDAPKLPYAIIRSVHPWER